MHLAYDSNFSLVIISAATVIFVWPLHMVLSLGFKQISLGIRWSQITNTLILNVFQNVLVDILRLYMPIEAILRIITHNRFSKVLILDFLKIRWHLILLVVLLSHQTPLIFLLFNYLAYIYYSTAIIIGISDLRLLNNYIIVFVILVYPQYLLCILTSISHLYSPRILQDTIFD